MTAPARTSDAIVLNTAITRALDTGAVSEVNEELRLRGHELTKLLTVLDLELDEYLGQTDPESELFLAVALPILDRAAQESLIALAFALSDLASPLAEGAPARRPQEAFVAVGRILWPLTAFTVWRGQFDTLAALVLSRVPAFRPGTAESPLLTDLRLRYPDVLQRDPTATFNVYLHWAKQCRLIHVQYPSFATELDSALAEADMLLALRAHAAHDWANYSAGASWNRFAPIRSLRRRLDDQRQRSELARFFGVEIELLPEMLDRLYAGLQTNPAFDGARPGTFWQ